MQESGNGWKSPVQPDLLTLQDVLRRMAGRATRTHLNRGEALYINQSRR
jgi:hypothetical protein